GAEDAAQLRVGARAVRRADPALSLAAEPRRDADEHEDAASPAGAAGDPEEVQRRSEAAAGSDHEGVQGSRHESPQSPDGVPADAPADADPLRALLRVPEHDRVPRGALPLA